MSKLYGFELHKSSTKSTKILFKIMQAIIIKGTPLKWDFLPYMSTMHWQ